MELAKHVSKMEKEFFSSFTVQELEAELEQLDDDDDDFIDVPSLKWVDISIDTLECVACFHRVMTIKQQALKTINMRQK